MRSADQNDTSDQAEHRPCIPLRQSERGLVKLWANNSPCSRRMSQAMSARSGRNVKQSSTKADGLKCACASAWGFRLYAHCLDWKNVSPRPTGEPHILILRRCNLPRKNNKVALLVSSLALISRSAWVGIDIPAPFSRASTHTRGIPRLLSYHRRPSSSTQLSPALRSTYGKDEPQHLWTSSSTKWCLMCPHCRVESYHERAASR